VANIGARVATPCYCVPADKLKHAMHAERHTGARVFEGGYKCAIGIFSFLLFPTVT
jgi:hypothetical protein